jgi:hypothetical protein
MPEVVEFACEECKVVTKDKQDPAFTGPWLCYWCHCLKEGHDPKVVLNTFAEAIKLGRLISANSIGDDDGHSST